MFSATAVEMLGFLSRISKKNFFFVFLPLLDLFLCETLWSLNLKEFNSVPRLTIVSCKSWTKSDSGYYDLLTKYNIWNYK